MSPKLSTAMFSSCNLPLLVVVVTVVRPVMYCHLPLRSKKPGSLPILTVGTSCHRLFYTDARPQSEVKVLEVVCENVWSGKRAGWLIADNRDGGHVS